MVKSRKIQSLVLALSLLVCVFSYAQVPHVQLGANVSSAVLIEEEVTASVADGTENYFRIEAKHLPATVYYWPDTAFGPIPLLISAIGEDTLPATMVSEKCRMGWRWELPEAGEEETVRYLYFFAHENNATAGIRPTICIPTESETTEVVCDSMLWNGEWRKESGDYTYVTQNAAGCDSTATLHLTVNPSYHITLPELKICDEYIWGDTVIYDSGTYTRRFQTTALCDSVVTQTITILESSDPTKDVVTAYDTYTWNGVTYTKSIKGPSKELKNQAGCDSIVSLELTIRHLTRDTLREAICASEAPFIWRGKQYSETGTYNTDTLLGPALDGLVFIDTVHTLELTVNPVYAVDTFAVSCGTEFTWRGTLYTSSGEYAYPAATQAGCDSIVTLHLTLNQPTMGDTTASACISFDWYEHHCTESGIYTHVFPEGNANKCDSTVTLHLAIYQPTKGDTTAHACVSFDWYEHHCTESGTYTHTFVGGNAHGCDSTVTLQLTIHQPTEGEEWQEACEQYVWHGKAYSQSGDYQITLENAAHCDSTATLHLTILHATSGEEWQEACEQYTWHGKTYSQSGDYPITLENAEHCDSIATLHLTIHPTYLFETEVQTCQDSYLWHNRELSKTGTYYDSLYSKNGCDSVHVLYLTMGEGCEPVCRDVLVQVNGCILINRDLIDGFEGMNIQWWHDDEKIDADVDRLNMPGRESGDYMAMLTRKGCLRCDTLRTCAIHYQAGSADTYVSDEGAITVYPTQVPMSDTRVHVKTNTKGVYFLYNSTGKLFLTEAYETPTGMMELSLPAARGLYVLIFVPIDEQEQIDRQTQQVKLIVY